MKSGKRHVVLINGKINKVTHIFTLVSVLQACHRTLCSPETWASCALPKFLTVLGAWELHLLAPCSMSSKSCKRLLHERPQYTDQVVPKVSDKRDSQDWMAYYRLFALEFVYPGSLNCWHLQPEQLPKAVSALDCLSVPENHHSRGSLEPGGFQRIL